MKVKICGIKNRATALKAIEYGADALGFVFAESKRKVSPETASKIISRLPGNIMKIGVFVNEEKETIERIVHECGLTHVQLHGDEPPEFCESISLPVIKAFNIAKLDDIKAVKSYNCGSVLFDSPKGQFNGGTGIPFNWELIGSADFSGKKVILAGGLNPGNVIAAIQAVQPYMVDVSSGVETDGKKDYEKIKTFIEAAKQTGGVRI